jgi:hypothetical protein
VQPGVAVVQRLGVVQPAENGRQLGLGGGGDNGLDDALNATHVVVYDSLLGDPDSER